MSQSAGLQDPDIYREKTPKPGDRFVQEFDFGKKPAVPTAEPQMVYLVMRGSFSNWDYNPDGLFTDYAVAQGYCREIHRRGARANIVQLKLDDPKLLMIAKAHLPQTK
jgi:hypothetical protein